MSPRLSKPHNFTVDAFKSVCIALQSPLRVDVIMIVASVAPEFISQKDISIRLCRPIQTIAKAVEALELGALVHRKRVGHSLMVTLNRERFLHLIEFQSVYFADED